MARFRTREWPRRIRQINGGLRWWEWLARVAWDWTWEAAALQTMEATADIIISKPIKEVFEFAAAPKNWDKWVKGISNVQIITPGKYRVGTVVTSDYEYRGVNEMRYVVTAWKPPNLHAVRAKDGPFPFDGRIRFESVEGGTRVYNTISAGSDHKCVSVMWVVGRPIFKRMMRRQLGRELVELKEQIEKE